MPWKQWAFMERVPSDQFQSYLQDQAVAQFTSLAQRDSVLTPVPPKAGQICAVGTYLYVWTGTAWKGLPAGRVAYLAFGQNQVSNPSGILATAPVFTTLEPRLVRIDTAFYGPQVTAGGNLIVTHRLNGVDSNRIFAISAVVGTSYPPQFGVAETYWTSATGGNTAAIFVTITAGAYRTDSLYPNFIAVHDLGTP